MSKHRHDSRTREAAYEEKSRIFNKAWDKWTKHWDRCASCRKSREHECAEGRALLKDAITKLRERHDALGKTVSE